MNKDIVVSDELRKLAVKELEFLRDHPAFGENFDYRCLSWWMMECDKEGTSDVKGPHNLYWNEPEAVKFKDKFLEYYSEAELEKSPATCSVFVSYEEKYGKPWEYDHIEFWWELSFMVYEGDLNRTCKGFFDNSNWGCYAFEMAGATSWEQCIVDMAKQVREKLGDFNSSSFENEFEKENYKNEAPFLESELKCYLKINKKSWITHHGILNRRWLQWFHGTEYCKKNWSRAEDGWDEFGGRVKAKIPVKNERVPIPDRKRLLYRVKSWFSNKKHRIKRFFSRKWF